MGPVLEAAAKGEMDRAKRLLARHFKARNSPTWIIDWRFSKRPFTTPWNRRHTWGTGQLPELKKRANAPPMDDVCLDRIGDAHDISRQDLLPDELKLDGSTTINFFNCLWAVGFGEMYASTFDEKYAKALRSLFFRFRQESR